MKTVVSRYKKSNQRRRRCSLSIHPACTSGHLCLLPTTLGSANIWRCTGKCCGSGLPLIQAIRGTLSVENRKAMIKLSQLALLLSSCREVLNIVSDTISLPTLKDQDHCSCIPLGFLANTSMSPLQHTRIEVRALAYYFSQLLTPD